MINKFLQRFILGTLSMLPIIFVFQIIFWVEELFRKFIIHFYGLYEELIFIPISLFITSVSFLIYLGYLVEQDKAHLIYFMDYVINKIPLLSSIYRITKKILLFFKGGDNVDNRTVVYVEYPMPNVWMPAYVTQKQDEHYVLYIPTSPNPTSGFTVIVHESKIRESKMGLEDVSAFIISLGVDYPHVDEMKGLFGGKRLHANTTP
jgi:uncharacterized membrane protein